VRVVFAALPAYGHLYPLIPLALSFRRAGHDVVVATGAPFVDRLPLRTWESLSSDHDLHWAEDEAARSHPDLSGLELTVAMFADTVGAEVSGSLLPELTRWSPDLVVYEAMNVGAGVAADVLGIPAVAFSVSLAERVPGVIHTAAVGHLAHRWTDHDRQPPPPGMFARALLDPTPPSLRSAGEEGATLRLPIRSVAYSQTEAVLPTWLGAPTGRPRVYLTLGTVAFGAVEVLRRAVTDIAALDVDLLVAVGPDGDPAALGPVPDSVHVERFVAQSEVLGLVDLAVHHGGTGTVLATLAAGLPQLVLPQGADQFYNAEAVSRAGVGRALLEHEQSPGAIAEAVSALLAPGSERTLAVRLSREIAAQPDPDALVSRLEELARR
jgi:UDP:flavonoid glycosyltransferase YjiC (YdhE family)